MVGVVISSPVGQSAQSEKIQPESPTFTEPPAITEPPTVAEPPIVAQPPTAVAHDLTQVTTQPDVSKRAQPPNHVVGDFVTEGVTKGTFLAVSALPMGRSSRYVKLSPSKISG